MSVSSLEENSQILYQVIFVTYMMLYALFRKGDMKCVVQLIVQYWFRLFQVSPFHALFV